MPTALEISNHGSCATCGAMLDLRAARCWLCHAAIPRDENDGASDAGGSRSPWAAAQDRVGSYSLASLLLLFTLASVVLGVSTIAPGVGIPLGVILLVVWIRTSAVARLRRERGLAVTRTERTQLFLASFGTTVALLSLTSIAGCAAYFGACLACLGTWAGLEGIVPENTATLLAYAVYVAVALAIMVPVFWWCTKTIRRRWRRDIGEPDPTDASGSASYRLIWGVLLLVLAAVAWSLWDWLL